MLIIYRAQSLVSRSMTKPKIKFTSLINRKACSAFYTWLIPGGLKSWGLIKQELDEDRKERQDLVPLLWDIHTLWLNLNFKAVVNYLMIHKYIPITKLQVEPNLCTTQIPLVNQIQLSGFKLGFVMWEGFVVTRSHMCVGVRHLPGQWVCWQAGRKWAVQCEYQLHNYLKNGK